MPDSHVEEQGRLGEFLDSQGMAIAWGESEPVVDEGGGPGLAAGQVAGAGQLSGEEDAVGAVGVGDGAAIAVGGGDSRPRAAWSRVSVPPRREGRGDQATRLVASPPKVGTRSASKPVTREASS
jgi:hypothetical protein